MKTIGILIFLVITAIILWALVDCQDYSIDDVLDLDPQDADPTNK